MFTSYITPVSSKDFLDIHATMERRFNLKRVREIIRTYSQETNVFVTTIDSSLNFEVTSLKFSNPIESCLN